MRPIVLKEQLMIPLSSYAFCFMNDHLKCESVISPIRLEGVKL
jgi:hypothetical protein